MNPILQRDIQRARASLSDFRALYESVPSTEDLSVSLNDTFSVFKKSIEGSGAGITAQTLPTVREDARQIAMYSRILSNALKYAERIFGLFKRLHRDEYPGTGLRLAIYQPIVARYDGRIWTEGRPGDGATFYFAFLKAELP
jgi:signal transduction histidine kinase